MDLSDLMFHTAAFQGIHYYRDPKDPSKELLLGLCEGEWEGERGGIRGRGVRGRGKQGGGGMQVEYNCIEDQGDQGRRRRCTYSQHMQLRGQHVSWVDFRGLMWLHCIRGHVHVGGDVSCKERGSAGPVRSRISETRGCKRRQPSDQLTQSTACSLRAQGTIARAAGAGVRRAMGALWCRSFGRTPRAAAGRWSRWGAGEGVWGDGAL